MGLLTLLDICQYVLYVLKVVNTTHRTYLVFIYFFIHIFQQIIAATIITHYCGLTSTYAIDVVGEIPSG